MGGLDVPIRFQPLILPVGLERLLPNPGQGGSYDPEGTFRFIDTGSSGTAVAIGRAEQPYRD